mmetsp:Transcript_44863/g.109465  ORF Transcript_44863/g.109465 Transcript_44863/m.109465 type:complete len:299 (-) Transcript_44863:823-1719(-)|eukprot:CAMPEP_0172074378 /NCGR_PEP_ID=MMETSP1043-20130122/15377_1 /TAXON_ID=464988 /ORGANISM="Hemiselmis andersenii, Strain CCMP441" /LENGTH=298 /DNA_ID=CAMNT_0012735029 /DNA_START=56 /DNA_END=952 /DNA_ORIENTATION=-
MAALLLILSSLLTRDVCFMPCSPSNTFSSTSCSVHLEWPSTPTLMPVTVHSMYWCFVSFALVNMMECLGTNVISTTSSLCAFHLKRSMQSDRSTSPSLENTWLISHTFTKPLQSPANRKLSVVSISTQLIPSTTPFLLLVVVLHPSPKPSALIEPADSPRDVSMKCICPASSLARHTDGILWMNATDLIAGATSPASAGFSVIWTSSVLPVSPFIRNPVWMSHSITIPSLLPHTSVVGQLKAIDRMGTSARSIPIQAGVSIRLLGLQSLPLIFDGHCSTTPSSKAASRSLRWSPLPLV